MDAETAKTLVSVTLVACIAAFSLVAFRAVLAQMAADLTAARRVPAKVTPRPEA